MRTYDVQSAIEERNRVLRALDTQFLIANGCSPEAALIALHKARYECRDLEDALRIESGEWLRTRGYVRMLDLGEILPTGELPK